MPMEPIGPGAPAGTVSFVLLLVIDGSAAANSVGTHLSEQVDDLYHAGDDLIGSRQ